MTCDHQWNDATSSAGPEWVCSRCRVTYTETKKTLSAPKRQWVDLTPQDLNEIFKVANTGEGAVRLALEKIKEKNT